MALSLVFYRVLAMGARGGGAMPVGRHFSFFGGDGNSGNPGRVPGIVRLEEIRGVVLDDEETRVNGR